MKNKQLAVVEFRNGGVFLYEFQSDKKIDIDKVAQYLEDNENWNEDRDSITLVDKPEKIVLK